jgi:DNA-binding response OmpR family regulator
MESPTSSLGKAKPLVREIVAEPPAEMVGGTETGSAGSLNGAATVRILVVEDNPKMSLAVEKGLTAQGYAVDAVDRGYDAEEAAASTAYDVIVLDLMLPDRDGVDICKALRRRGIKTPVLMLTALSGTQDKVTGLNSGADDYLTKPFEFDELLARIRALLRRGSATESSVLRFEDLELDLLKRVAKREGEVISLTAKEFALLEYFVRNSHRLLTRTQIGEHVWDMNFEPGSNVIDVYVSALRRKIDKGFSKPLIHTKIGSGYILSAEPPP